MRETFIFAAVSALGLGLLAGAASAGESSTKTDQPVTDSYITTKVKAELAKDSATKARHIHVKTKEGTVYLTGSVNSDMEKEKAEQDASGVKGVSHVDNALTVKGE